MSKIEGKGLSMGSTDGLQAPTTTPDFSRGCQVLGWPNTTAEGASRTGCTNAGVFLLCRKDPRL